MEKSPLPHEQILQLAHHQASALANTFPEVRGVLVTIVWDQRLGQELPFGVIVFPKGVELTPELVLASLQQNAKLATAISGQLERWASTTIEILQKQQERIRELEARLRPPADLEEKAQTT